jgi:hypothetical protein
MLRAALTSALHCPALQATQTKTAWLLRFSGAMCPQAEHRCDVYADGTPSSRPVALWSSRATSWPHPWRLIARLRPRFCATRTPGRSRVPRVERVIARTSSASTRMVSNRRAISVVVFSTQSRRRLASRALILAIATLVRCRRLEPRWERAMRCYRWRSRVRSPDVRLGVWSSAPVDSAAETVTPRSTPTTLPIRGPGIGSGIWANATCQRPARSRVMR